MSYFPEYPPPSFAYHKFQLNISYNFQTPSYVLLVHTTCKFLVVITTFELLLPIVLLNVKRAIKNTKIE